MATYPFLVDVAWGVLHQFVKDWQDNPYRWSKEQVAPSFALRNSAALFIFGRTA